VTWCPPAGRRQRLLDQLIGQRCLRPYQLSTSFTPGVNRCLTQAKLVRQAGNLRQEEPLSIDTPTWGGEKRLNIFTRILIAPPKGMGSIKDVMPGTHNRRLE
jgi:hypothetical protein